MTQEKKYGVSGGVGDITTTYQYLYVQSPSRQVVKTIISPASGTDTLISYRRYDLAGRLVEEEDAAELTTSYEYATDEPTVTVTRPGGAQEITEHYLEGRVKSVGGSNVVPRVYAYEAVDGERRTIVWTGTTEPYDELGRWTESVYDRLGRIWKERRPAADGGPTFETVYTYNSLGQLEKVVTPGQADTLYVYDSLGSQTASGLDVSGDDSLTAASTDRLTETNTRYVQDNGQWWRETATTVQTTDNVAGDKVITFRRERLTGYQYSDNETTTHEQSTVVEYWQHDYGVPYPTQETSATTTTNRTAKQVTQTTNVPGSSTPAESVTVNGLLTSSTSASGVVTTYGYDGFGRQITVTDGRENATTTHYNDKGQVEYTENANGDETWYTYDPDTGRLASVGSECTGSDDCDEDDFNDTYYTYNASGQLEKVWGEAAQPTWTEYDEYGQRTTLHTYRDALPSGTGTWPTGDVTQWSYGATTGLLTAKTDALDNAVEYSYTAEGKLEKRTWARLNGTEPLDTTYGYDDNTGELTSIDYSDTGTGADLEFTYTRLGQVATVTDADPSGTDHGFDYGQWPEQVTEDITGLYSQTIVREYDAAAGGRLAGLTVQDAQAQEVYAAGYFYDVDGTGRMSWVTGPGLPAFGAWYGYMLNGSEEPGADLVTTIDLRSDANNTVARTVRSYEAHRNLIGLVWNIWDPDTTSVTVSRYEYTNDILGRRTDVEYTGSAFTSPPIDQSFDYNARNELTGSQRDGAAWLYGHDNIGNRTTSTIDSAETTYDSNELNQYAEITPPSSSPLSLEYDEDGNLTKDDRDLTYAYDTENRLTAVAKLSPGAGDKKVVFGYDYQGRRVRRQVFAWNTGSGSWSTTPELDRRFVYDGWNAVMFLDGLNSNAIVRKQVWGLDLSGLGGNATAGGIHGAGGIGGLLAVVETQGTYQGTYWYLYDGNGNVGQVLSATTYNVVAHYEYDPYGNAIVASGNYAAANPYRFSTKQWDANIGLGYWGYRYYSPTTGRWLSRDPIEEKGGWNLYEYVRSSPVASVDPLGQFILPEPLAPPPPAATCEQRHANCMACAAGRNSECLSRGYSVCLTYCAVRYRWCWGSFNTGFNHCLIRCYDSFYRPACDRDDGANTAYCDKKLAWCQGKGPDPGYGWGIGPGGGCPF